MQSNVLNDLAEAMEALDRNFFLKRSSKDNGKDENSFLFKK